MCALPLKTLNCCNGRGLGGSSSAAHQDHQSIARQIATEAITPTRSASKPAGMACRVCFTDRSKVNGSDIKRGLRASVNGRGRKADDIIRAKPMDDFSQ